MSRTLRTATVKRRVRQVRGGAGRWRSDALAVEEPLEIRLYPAAASSYLRVAVTMRTPGHDFELAAGFLFTEGVLDHPRQVRSITYCTDPDLDGDQEYNIVNVYLAPGVAPDPQRLQRNFYTASSCGICGKASIEAVRVRYEAPPADHGFVIDGAIIGRLGPRLRRAQTLFERTGGLHAAGLFDGQGRLLILREDVGRHNAVDKLIGHAFLRGQMVTADRACAEDLPLPPPTEGLSPTGEARPALARSLLMVSGRASFEITQKAAVAGIPIVVAVSAPSSLACDLARDVGMTLIGFARDDRFNVYAGGHRVRHAGTGSPPPEAGAAQ